ncbi:MAG: hypothetical protein ACR2PY_02830, partial [Salinispira sp.]
VIPFIVHVERLRTIPNTAHVSIRNSRENIIETYTFKVENSRLPDLILDDLNLNEDVYSLRVELFHDDEFIEEHEAWFFYVRNDIPLRNIIINPHFAYVGETVDITALFQEAHAGSPWLQFRMDDELLYQGQSLEDELNFTVQAPEISGIYNLQFDIYPWFDGRINETVKSSTQYNVALMVLDSILSAAEHGEYRINVPSAIDIRENLLFYQDERPSFSVDLSPNAPFSDPVFFEMRDSQFMLSFEKIESDVTLIMYRDNMSRTIETVMDREAENIRIEYQENGNDLILFVFADDDMIYGDLISLTELTEGEVQFTPGLQTKYPLEEILIRHITEKKSVEDVLRTIYGDALLYAEGFDPPEPADLPEPAEPLSEDDDSPKGYFILSPSTSVNTPPFVLGDFSIIVEAVFHHGDNLEFLDIRLFQDDEEEQQVFSLSDLPQFVDAYIHNKGVLRLALSTSDDALQLMFQDEVFPLPLSPENPFYISFYQAEPPPLRVETIFAFTEELPEQPNPKPGTAPSRQPGTAPGAAPNPKPGAAPSEHPPEAVDSASVSAFNTLLP